ncbi:MAG TPA: translation initiation factor IF-2 [Gemmatimonadota bacterium]|nr:translation initiation factor IF-2 [Gemmatimonadota bacterium]
MGNLRVYEVAKDLGVESEHLIQLLHQMGVRVRSHMSSVTEAQIARLQVQLERERRSGGEATTDEKKPVRRRRRRTRATVTSSSEPDQEAEETEEVAAEAEEAEGAEAEDEAPVEVAAEAEADEAEEAEEAEQAKVDDVAAEADEDAVEVEVAEAADEDVEVEADEDEDEAEVGVAAEDEDEDDEGRPSKKRRRKVKPKPVRRGLDTAPAASAGPGGQFKMAEKSVPGGDRGRRRDRKKRRVDKDAVQKNVKKTLAAMDGSSSGGGRRRRRDTRPSQEEVEQQEQEREEREERERTTVKVNEFLTVAELSDLIDESPQAIITSAFKNLGLMVTINQRLDFDQIELICDEFNFTVEREEAYEAELTAVEEIEVDEEDLEPRAPVVTVMGHVDHGKTSLLDHIRRTNVIAGEAGGITQHIGAYHVEVGDGRSVAFLDTPGHEAFTAMRARGAELTDMVILVVAADDAVMPQTIEAISHAKNAGVPMVVAINKVDLPAADPGQVKQDLLSHEVVLEEFGGDVLSQEVSAKTGQGIEELLEKLLLQAELLDLKARSTGPARGTVVEAELDKGMGPVATVLVQSGRLEVGDDFICGLFGGRVRAMLDERENAVDEAGPSTPVRVLGLEGVPQAGDRLAVMEAARVREIGSRRQQLEREKDIRRRSKGTKLEDIFEAIQAEGVANLNIVIKGDTDGSVQALSDSLERLSTSEVAVEIVHRGVGAVSESDVLLAMTTNAFIIGFHVRPDTKARDVAEHEDVEIRTYSVIYEAVEDVRLALEGLLRPEEREVVVGTAEVREIFKVPKAGTVAGCYVSDGTIQRNLPVRLLRDYVEIYDGKVDSLKRFKDDVREVREGYECGISIENFNDIKIGDVIESYRVEEVARSLAQSAAADADAAS